MRKAFYLAGQLLRWPVDGYFSVVSIVAHLGGKPSQLG